MKFVNVLTGLLAVASATVQSKSNTGFAGRGGLRKLDGACPNRPDMVNLSQGRPTSQSSTWPNEWNGMMLTSDKAVDGQTASNTGMQHTYGQGSPNWWRVELDDGASVDQVTVYKRGDCCDERYYGFTVTLKKNGVVVTEYYQGPLFDGDSLDISFCGEVADEVEIRNDGSANELQFGEVVVMGVGDGRTRPYDCKATAWGDPHIVTFDGLKFDAQPKGEAIFVKDSASALQVQARTVALGTRGGVPAVIEGVAVQGYDEDSPIIEVSVGDGPATVGSCSVDLIVSGDKKAGFSYSDETATVTRDGTHITIEYQHTIRIDMYTRVYNELCYFSIHVTLLDCGLVKDTVRGILGSPNGNPQDDWMTRNGTTLPIPRGASGFFFEPAFEYCKENWVVEVEEESLFDYTGSTTFADVSVPDEEFDNEYQRAVEEAGEDLIEICGDDIGCLVDGVELGPEAAREYLEEPASERAVIVNTEPTASPTASPTTSPTTSPTASPTTSPTTSPTPSPTEEDDLICPE